MFASSLPLAIPILACSAEVQPDESPGQSQSRVIYGNDDRVEPFEYSTTAWAARVAEFSVALIMTGHLDISDPDSISISNRTLMDCGVCADERFASQPSLADCSGTLIDDDLVLTAGHCANSCRDYWYVFDYALTPEGTLNSITRQNIYECAEVVAVADNPGGLDHGVIRLDRSVVGRTPARVRVSDEALPVGTLLFVAGYPSGLPLKLADHATIRSNHPTLQQFVANLDTYRGNSGSGVFNPDTEELVGILVGGEADFVQDGGRQSGHLPRQFRLRCVQSRYRGARRDLGRRGGRLRPGRRMITHHNPIG